MNGYKFLSFDVMMGERWVCTLHYRYCPAFALDYEKLREYIEKKRPSLKGQEYTIAF